MTTIGNGVIQRFLNKLSLLSDVSISSPTNTQALIYDSASGLWKNQNQSGGGGGGMAIGSAVTGGTANSVLYIDGSGNLAQRNPGFTYDGATLTVRGNSSANVQVWQDNSGNAIASLSKDGSQLVLANSNNPFSIGGLSSVSIAGDLAIGFAAQATGQGTGIGYAANGTNSGTAVGFTANASGGGTAVAIGGQSSATAASAFALGGGTTASGIASIALGYGSTCSQTQTFSCGGSLYPIQNVFFGSGVTNASPSAYIINGCGGSGTDIAGANIRIAAGKGTGAGASGRIIFSTAPRGTTGTGLNSLVDQIGVSESGKIDTYASITTAGYGVPAIYGAGRATAQTGANASVATYTVGASDGSFYVSANANVTTFVAGTFNVTVSYTDETNTAQTLKLSFSTLTGTIGISIAASGPFEGIPAHIRCKASTAITIATSGTFTSLTYNVEGIISQLA